MRRLGTLDVVGAYRAPRSMGRPALRPGQQRGNWNALQPLGIGAVTFTATSGTSLTASQQVQKLFHPKRLIIDIARTGVSATGLVTVTAINVGADNQLATAGSTGPIPSSMFANVGVDLNLNFAPATPGITISIAMQISTAPTTTDTVSCSLGMLGATPSSSAPQSQFSHW